MKPLRVIVVGLGAIGGAAAAACLEREELDLVGAVDPRRAGERLGDVEVAPCLASIPDDAEVALLCTASALPAVRADLETLVAAGLDVASTCEELTLPWFTDRAIAERLDARARAAGKTILGAGVNPGLIMDVLPVMLGTASLRPRAVTVRRLVDLGHRRPQLRDKLGVGRAVSEWHAVRARNGAAVFGHFGLVESARLLALGLGWPVDATTFAREPVAAGDVVNGVREVARLSVPGDRRIELELVFELGGSDVDRIEVDGDPPLELVAQGGVQGDKATVARLLAAAGVVARMPAGLRLAIESPLWSGKPV